ncbi:hypothetical protein D0469_06365 [Peribacillus saganii]|uniref:Uncharacterized protein n=1 Tax=Peribacillus saganii TaxID=2303992 RepID=A0A372LQP5_9BACI|nr:hypothetical protein D0469_06365 [Peribacillus saganii]
MAYFFIINKDNTSEIGDTESLDFYREVLMKEGSFIIEKILRGYVHHYFYGGRLTTIILSLYGLLIVGFITLSILFGVARI